MVSLPTEVSTQVFREFPPEVVKSLSAEIAKLPPISQDVKDSVIKEFFQSTDMGAIAEKPIVSAFDEVLDRRGLSEEERPRAGGKPLDFLKRVDPHQILAIIRREHPQTIALIISHLHPPQASRILAELAPHVQTEVARRIAEIGKIAPEILTDVEQVLETRLYGLMEGRDYETDSKDALVEILSQADRSTEQKIMSGLTQKSPNLANQMKEQMCEFSDLEKLDESSLTQVLRITDIRDLVLALKGASPKLGEKIYSCMSPDAAKALKEDVEQLGRPDWEQVKGAQQQIRNNLRGLVTIGKVRL